MEQDVEGDDIDVVLAVEDAATATDLTVDEVVMTPPGTPADKLAATLRVFRERVQHLS